MSGGLVGELEIPNSDQSKSFSGTSSVFSRLPRSGAPKSNFDFLLPDFDFIFCFLIIWEVIFLPFSSIYVEVLENALE